MGPSPRYYHRVGQRRLPILRHHDDLDHVLHHRNRRSPALIHNLTHPHHERFPGIRDRRRCRLCVTSFSGSALIAASPDPARVTTRARQFEQLSQVLVDCGTLGVEARGDFARLPLCSALGRSAVRHCPAMDGIEAGTVSKWRYGQVVDRRIAPRPVGGACRPGRRGCISSPLASLPLGGVLLAYGAVREPHVV